MPQEESEHYSGAPFEHAISDAVHGQISLTRLEMQIVSHPYFQRLRNIKQLGLASLVYPSADYSRFSHSLGAMNAMGKLMQTLWSKHDEEISLTMVLTFRLAALLHDIGHYPLSHLYEQAIATKTSKKVPQVFNHEKAGAFIVETKLKDILDSSEVNASLQSDLKNRLLEPKTLASFLADVIRHDASVLKPLKTYGILEKLLSGAVDCDRLDYLLRTSKGAGLPYGVVDLDYLISCVKLKDGELAFARKAQHSATHMLESRVYDYLTTSYHRTVKSLEEELRIAVVLCMDKDELPYEEGALKNTVSGKSWETFDDGHLRSLLAENKDQAISTTAGHVYGRSPRKTVFSRTLDLSKNFWLNLWGFKTFMDVLEQELRTNLPTGVPAGDWYVQFVEALKQEEAATFKEMVSPEMEEWEESEIPNTGVRSELHMLRDRITLVVHYYLSREVEHDESYKTKYDRELEAHVLRCIQAVATKAHEQQPT